MAIELDGDVAAMDVFSDGTGERGVQIAKLTNEIDVAQSKISILHLSQMTNLSVSARSGRYRALIDPSLPIILPISSLLSWNSGAGTPVSDSSR
jgi:hypothetical protein